jgi:thioredoxin 1
VGAAAVAAVALKNSSRATAPPSSLEAGGESARSGLPRLVDLGAGKCIPCKAMKPILDELMSTHAEHFETVFIDVWENKEAGKEHGVRMIPTQIFLDEEGNELFRHEGFFSKEEILNAWKELGYNFPASAGGPCCTP